MFKKWTVILLIITFLLFSAFPFFTAAENKPANLTTEDKLEDFNALYSFIVENCPYLPVREEAKRNWYDRKGEFFNLVRETDNDLEYYQTLNRILGVLGNGHTNLVSPDYYNYLTGLPLNKVWQQVLLRKDVRTAYNYWENVLAGDNRGQSFLARYIAGDYYVLYSAFPELPEGARITAVNGEVVDNFVQENGSALYEDPLNEKVYARFIPVPDRELKIAYLYNSKSAEAVIPGRVARDKQVKSAYPSSGENVRTRVLAKDQVAYLKVASFGYQNIAHDQAIIASFYNQIKDYPYLIIDIRGNGGGDDSYWQDLLVAPLLNKTLARSFYVFYRSGKYVQPFIESNVGPGKAFMRVGRNTLLKRMELPEALLTADYMDPLKLPYLIRPKGSSGFKGKVILMVDNLVYSSAESFAAFARATGWATLVGTGTGGDGIGFTPIEFMLPNSKLLVRIPETIGLNPDGSINIEGQTTPDYYLDYQPEDYLKIWNGEMKPGEDQMVEEVLSLIDQRKLRPAKPLKGSFLSRFFRDYDGDYGYPVEKDLDRFNGQVIESLQIVGAFKTDKELISRIIGLNAGDRFTANAVRLAEERLKSFDSHTSVSIDVQPGAENRIKLIAFIQEGVGFALDPVSLSYNLVNDIIDKRISYTHYNLGRKMVNIKGVCGYSPAKERSLSLTGPLFPGIPTKGKVSTGTYIDQRRISQGNQQGSYLINTAFLNFTDLIIPEPGLKLTLGLKYLREKVEQIQSQTGLMLADADYLDGSIEIIRNPYNLTGGLIINIAGIGGFYPYLNISAKKEVGLGRKFSLYLRGKASWAIEDTPVNHLLFPGGNDTFAAYNQGILVGNRYLAAGFELRKYLNKDLYLAVLADGGYVWQPGEKLQFEDPPGGLGLAARYRTPVGMVFEGLYAFDPGREKQQRYTFGLSKEF